MDPEQRDACDGSRNSASPPGPSGSTRMALRFDDVRKMALSLPGVEDATSYGTPALKVGKKLLVRLKEDGETIVLRLGFDEREMLVEAELWSFFITEHYRAYPNVLVRLAHVHP